MSLLFLASSATVNPITLRVATGDARIGTIFGAAAAILLVGLLILRELLEAYAQEPHVQGTTREEAIRGLSRATTVATIPLVGVFALAVFVKVVAVL